MMHLLLALAAIVVLPQRVVASDDWWFVSTGGDRPDRLVVFMDKSSAVKNKGDIVTMREIDYHEPASSGAPASLAMAQFEYVCGARTFRTISETNLSPDGSAIPGGKVVPPTGVTKVAAGTMGEKELDFACGRSGGAAQIVGSTNLSGVGQAILDSMDHADRQLSEAR